MGRQKLMDCHAGKFSSDGINISHGVSETLLLLPLLLHLRARMNRRRPGRDDDREERITMEIIMDAYNESEASTGWYCYLENTLAFPFEGECVKSRKMSPLKPRERVTVLGMLDDDEGDGLGEMMVEATWRDCTMGIPLAQIKGIGVDEKTVEAIADWHYWVAQGRQF